MITIHQIEELETFSKPIHIALGVFDGVHIGHQAVIQTAIDYAAKSDGLAGVMTFDPHPIQVVAPERAPLRILASISHKATVIKNFGCDFLLVQHFDKDFANQPAKDFIFNLKKLCPALKSISIGEDWRFGNSREGTIHNLKLWGEELGIEIIALAPVKTCGERVSSTRIR
ncbi:FAD synthetase family protein, partial [Akkermansiaceae bacterium]|nr:FAD synthetase family protein [Akkermansiaceae bacterium]